MDNLIIEELLDGTLKITPKDGYLIMDIRTEARHSEAYIKRNNLRYYKAVEA